MPDPAIEATRLGLPYTEPTSKSMFSRRRPTAQVKWETNPNDPTAPPRKVIEVNDDSKVSSLVGCPKGALPPVDTLGRLGCADHQK